jgi:hypothetical protein
VAGLAARVVRPYKGVTASVSKCLAWACLRQLRYTVKMRRRTALLVWAGCQVQLLAVVGQMPNSSLRWGMQGWVEVCAAGALLPGGQTKEGCQWYTQLVHPSVYSPASQPSAGHLCTPGGMQLLPPLHLTTASQSQVSTPAPPARYPQFSSTCQGACLQPLPPHLHLA